METRRTKGIYRYNSRTRKMRRVRGSRFNSRNKKTRVPENVKRNTDYAWNNSKREFVPVSAKYGYATSLKNWIAKRKPIKTTRRLRSSPSVNQRGGRWGLADFLPTTGWSTWQGNTGALATGPSSVVPPALANGGLYTGPQSTGAWASQPVPATQWAHQSLSAAVSGVQNFTHQRINDNMGASYSPVFHK